MMSAFAKNKLKLIKELKNAKLNQEMFTREMIVMSFLEKAKLIYLF